MFLSFTQHGADMKRVFQILRKAIYLLAVYMLYIVIEKYTTIIIEKYTTESKFSSLFRLKKLHSDTDNVLSDISEVL